MDTMSKECRSRLMSRVKSKDTTSELFVRSLLHRAGYRFRLHVKTLPGKPDIVLPKYKTIIEIRGCFWHSHQNCKQGRIPKTRQEWWTEKLARNVIRDNTNTSRLQEAGWRIIVIWDCFFKRVGNNGAKVCLGDVLVYIVSLFLRNKRSNYIEIDRASYLKIRDGLLL